MGIQTQEYLGRGPKKKKAKWVEVKFHYDPFIDGLSLGGGPEELAEGECRIGTVKPGTQVLLGNGVVVVESHSGGSTVIKQRVARTITTKAGEEASISGSETRRVSSNVVVSTRVPDTKTKPPKTISEKRNSMRVPKIGFKSASDLDADAKKRVEELLLVGGMKYSEIHAKVLGEIPDWNRSVSWVSNVAYYMRKDGRLKSK